MKMFLSNKKLELYIKSFLFFFVLCVGLTISPVFAQAGADDIQTSRGGTIYESDPFLQNPSTCSILCLVSPEDTDVRYAEPGQNEFTTCAGVGCAIAESLNGSLSTTRAEIARINNQSDMGNPDALVQFLRGNRGGAGLVDGVMAINGDLLNQRPASGTRYVEQNVYALLNFGEVSAQDTPEALYYRGTGFDLLRPIQSLWGFSVNITYGLLIFLIIGVAFGIMFRAKLSGETVITLQNSIPNIALAMILVPLSYAISGLFIDGITLGVNATHAFFFTTGAPTRDIYVNRNEEYPCDRLIGFDDPTECDRGLHADDIRVSWLYSGANLSAEDELESGVSGLTAIFFAGDRYMQAFLNDLTGVVGPIVNFVIGIILLLTGFRIFWKLLQKFIVFTIGPIFSPFIFATVAVPGNGFSRVVDYCKFMGAATLHYVVAYGMILLSMIFSSAYFQAIIPEFGNATFVPPLLGLDAAFTTGGSNAQVPGGLIAFYFALISIGVYLLIPKTLSSIDEAMGVTGGIPLIGDVFQSAKDSVNVARSGLAGARAVGSAPGRLRNGALGGISRIQKGVFGINEDDYRNINNVIGRRASALTSRFDRAAEGINNPTLRSAARVGSAIGSRATRAAVGGAATGIENLGDRKLSGEFAWAGQKGIIKIDKSVKNQFLAQKHSGLSGAPYTFPGGKIVFTAEGFRLPAIVNKSNLSARQAIQEGNLTATTDYRRRKRPGPSGVSGGNESIAGDLIGDLREANNRLIIPGTLSPLFDFTGFTGWPEGKRPVIIYAGNSFPADSARKTVEVKVQLLIPGIGPNGKDGLEEFFNSLEVEFAQSSETAFRIDGVESNPVAFIIQPEFVNQ